MHILLIQIRPDAVIADHEFGLVVEKSGLSADAFRRVNATTPDGLLALQTLETLEGIDALFIGGSGDYLISHGDVPEVVAAISRVIQLARVQSTPTLGICFGGQLMAHALGGHVELDESRAEVGTFEVVLTAEGQKDPLFENLPTRFDVQQGHKDHFTVLPPGAVLLAGSDRSPNQAFTFPAEPLYGLQFHPELDEEAIKYRIGYYADAYQFTPEKLQAFHAAVRPSPQASNVIKFFLDTIVVQGKRHVSSVK